MAAPRRALAEADRNDLAACSALASALARAAAGIAWQSLVVPSRVRIGHSAITVAETLSPILLFREVVSAVSNLLWKGLPMFDGCY